MVTFCLVTYWIISDLLFLIVPIPSWQKLYGIFIYTPLSVFFQLLPIMCVWSMATSGKLGILSIIGFGIAFFVIFVIFQLQKVINAIFNMGKEQAGILNIMNIMIIIFTLICGCSSHNFD